MVQAIHVNAQIICPNSKLLVNDAGQCGAVALELIPTIGWQSSEYDELSYVITGATEGTGIGDANGLFFNIGLSTVTYNVYDDQALIGSCFFTIQVLDFETPQSPHCGKTIVVREDGFLMSDPVSLIQNSFAVDNCAGVSLSLNPLAVVDNCNSSSVFELSSGPDFSATIAVGNYALEYLYVDDAGTMYPCNLTLEVIPLPTFEILANPAPLGCEGDLLEIKPDNLVQDADIDWFGPNDFESNDLSPAIEINAGSAGEYQLIYETSNGCISSSSIMLNYIPDPIISLASNSPICEGALELSALLDGNSTPVAEWEWWGPCNFSMDGQVVSIENFDAACTGTYSVTASNNIGCETTESILIETASFGAPNLLSPCASVLCIDEPCLLMGTEYLQESVIYTWEFDEGLEPLSATDVHFVEYMGSIPGSFEVRYKVAIDGCESDWASISVLIPSAPIAVDDNYNTQTESSIFGQSLLANDQVTDDFEIQVIESTKNGQLTLYENGTFDYHPNAGYEGDDVFRYRICQNCGDTDCDEAMASVKVSFSGDCEVPTVITPNGDGKNDVLEMLCLSNDDYPSNSLKIYNLWGDQVFQASPYTNNWPEGLEQPLPDGTYFFIFQKSLTAPFEKGSITLQR